MPRAAAAAVSGVQTHWPFGQIRWGRFVFWLIAGVVLMVCTLLAWRSVEEFLIRDNRFRVAGGGRVRRAKPKSCA